MTHLYLPYICSFYFLKNINSADRKTCQNWFWLRSISTSCWNSLCRLVLWKRYVKTEQILCRKGITSWRFNMFKPAVANVDQFCWNFSWGSYNLTIFKFFCLNCTTGFEAMGAYHLFLNIFSTAHLKVGTHNSPFALFCPILLMFL